jgi:glycosyltransferase involved in cell wall biosynthesis
MGWVNIGRRAGPPHRVAAMKIGIELRHIQMGKSGGIAPLLAGVLDRLFTANPDHEFVVYRTIFNRSLVEGRFANVRTVLLPIAEPWWQYLQDALDRDPVDVLFRGFPQVDNLVFPLSRQVVLIPDLQHEEYPQFFAPDALRRRKLAFDRVLRGAGAIGTISEFSKRSILASPENRCHDILLMPPALRRDAGVSAADPLPEITRTLAAIGPYFYYPANLWQHKNHRRLIEAFELFRRETGRNISLVFTGDADGWSDISGEFRHLPLHHLGFVSGREQHAIYRGALATTFFSLYEGFGMPLLEAFASDCPVICSNTTSLPEVGADAVLSCSPSDVSAIAGLMERITTSPELRQALARAGRERLKQFSWDRSASALMAALTRIAAKNVAPPRPASPLVSIVTPSFNQAAFLRRTIDSVLSQTYGNIEYIVMDGGSTDGSVEILKSFGDRVRWISEQDRGQAHAINKGFALCRGQILGYLNSDDTLLPDAVEKVVSFFAGNPQCDMVYGEANYIDKKDHITGMYNTADYTFARLMLDCCVCQPAAFWSDRIAAAVGPFDESLDIVMDYDYWLRIARAGGHIKHLRQLIASSRRYLETKTLSRREEVYAEIFKICLKHGGYISPNYFSGLWHHRLHERNKLIANSMGRVPGFRVLLARAHQAWLSRHQITLRQRLTATIDQVSRRIHRTLAGAATAGIWPDAWLGPRAVFATSKIASESELFLAGYSACDGSVAVISGGKTLAEKRLRAGESVDIEFPSPQHGTVELRFSNSIIDQQKRVVSFRLNATNLLSEGDL